MTSISLLPGLLRALPLFAGMSEAALCSIARALQRRRYAKNAVIVRAGHVPEGLCILLAGQAKLVFEDARARALTLELLQPNAVFGALCADDSVPGITSVVALSPCEVLVLPTQALEALLRAYPEVAVTLLALAAQELRATQRKMIRLGVMDVRQRVASLLLEHSQECGAERLVGPGTEEIARMTGASREMVSRVLASMRDHGWIRRSGRRIAIVDRARIEGVIGDVLTQPDGHGPPELRVLARM
jgi:CRP-like cAMP-binding protein